MSGGPVTSQERVILGDWGSSRLRLWLRESGTTMAAHEVPGFLATLDEPPHALRMALESLGAGNSACRIVLSGMAGARGGLGETEYVPCPAGPEAWAGAALETTLDGRRVTILPGLSCRGRNDRPDVLRGEEAQVFGALALQPEPSEHSQVVVLPGTHCKWVDVEDGRIVHFVTCPTGEVYARLVGSSLAPQDGAPGNDEGFAAGLDRAFESEPLIGSLFEARAARLLDGRSDRWASGFLSGLLIGSEVAAMVQCVERRTVPLVIGSHALTALYGSAFERFGLDCRTADGETCALMGLEIADAATR